MDDAPPPPFTPDELDISALPATTEDLRQVLGRHRRRQSRMLGGGLVGVLVAGAIAGFAVGRDGAHTTTLSASQADRPAAPAPAANQTATTSSSGGAVASAPLGTGLPATQLLVRNATDGTRVRLYAQDMSPKFSCQPAGTPCPPPPACFPTSFVNAEVSDDQVAGVAGGPQWNVASTDALQPVAAQVVGGNEPQPILTVIAHVLPTVTKVVLSTTYGTDTEVPTATGWVALAEQLPATWTQAANSDGVPDGTVTATTATGSTAGTATVPSIGTKNVPPACQPQCPAVPPGAPKPADGTPPAAPTTGPGAPKIMPPHVECGFATSSGSGTASSGTASGGSVSSGSGTVSSGAATAPASPPNAR